MNLGMFILFKPVKLKVNQPSNEEKKRLKFKKNNFQEIARGAHTDD